VTRDELTQYMLELLDTLAVDNARKTTTSLLSQGWSPDDIDRVIEFQRGEYAAARADVMRQVDAVLARCEANGWRTATTD
jgi:hypothetical protein